MSLEKREYISELFHLVGFLEFYGEKIFASAGLTIKTFTILYRIFIGQNSSKELLSGIYGSKPNMAKKIKHLEERGYITRSIDPIDRRIHRFNLTETGQSILTELLPTYDLSLERLFRDISESEIEGATHMIYRLISDFVQSGKQ